MAEILQDLFSGFVYKYGFFRVVQTLHCRVSQDNGILLSSDGQQPLVPVPPAV